MRLMPKAASSRINKAVEIGDPQLPQRRDHLDRAEIESAAGAARRFAAGRPQRRRLRLLRVRGAADRTAGDHDADAARHRRHRAPSRRGSVDARGAACLRRGFRARRAEDRAARSDFGYYASRALFEPAGCRRQRDSARAQRGEPVGAGRRQPGDRDRRRASASSSPSGRPRARFRCSAPSAARP